MTKEQKEIEIALKEEEELLKKQRKREQEEYQYELQLSRKKNQDAYEAKKAAQEKELSERKASLEKDLSAREEKVAASEKELTELLEKVAAFPAEKEKAVEDSEKNNSEKLRSQHEHDMQFTKKDAEGEIRLLKQTISSLENKIKEQVALIRQLNQRSDNANTQVKEIAMKALEGASFQQFMAGQPEKKEWFPTVSRHSGS